jgi:hypothetical protein
LLFVLSNFISLAILLSSTTFHTTKGEKRKKSPLYFLHEEANKKLTRVKILFDEANDCFVAFKWTIQQRKRN